ncbi:MAG TPA: response regulator, partial [Candidatus Binatia bacterium]|nr:response regulator [Candidatus Binatia bacterium]
MPLAEIDKSRTAGWAAGSGKSLACNSPVQPSSAISSLIPNVLVVDDDATIRSLLVRLYSHSGYTVVPVSSAEEALSQLAQGNIDFVITDIKLPGLSGIDLIANMQ